MQLHARLWWNNGSERERPQWNEIIYKIHFHFLSANKFLPIFHAFLALIISANSGLREAPPTRNPSTSCWVAILKNDRAYISTTRQNRYTDSGINGRTQFLAVGGRNASAVQNLNVVGDSRGNCFGEVRAHIGVSFLCLSRSGDFASTDGPDGFVGNNDFAERKWKERT